MLPEESVQIGRNNRVSVATLIAVCGAIALGAFWVARADGRMSTFETNQQAQAKVNDELKDGIEDVRRSIDSLRSEILRRQDGYVSRDEINLMFRLLEKSNPQLDVPPELYRRS